MLIGYARVSTSDQKLDLQRDELKRAGRHKLFTDVAGGANTDRPGRTESLTYAQGRHDVVWKLDRFGRSLVDLVQTEHEFRDLAAPGPPARGHGGADEVAPGPRAEKRDGQPLGETDALDEPEDP